MDNTEHQRTQDDFDVEIVDLPSPGDEDDTESKRESAVDSSRISLRTSKFLRRRRTLQPGITASITVFVLLLILGSSISVRTLATRLFFPPTPVPTATLVPGIDLFYINGDLPWGQASLDGHLLTHLPKIGIDPPLRFTRGHHLLQWRADPFQAQRCTISVPPQIDTDTCQFNNSVQLPSGLGAWIISFPASLAVLSASQRGALLRTAQAALNAQHSTETVRPGELYNAPTQNGASQRGIFATARQALLATLHFQLDTDQESSMACAINGQSCLVLGQDCHLFCTNPAASTAPSSSSALEWDVLAVAFPVWNYTTLDGHSIARNQPDAFGGATGYEFLVSLHIIWDGTAWHVTALLDSAGTQTFGDPVCGSAEVEVSIDPSLSRVLLDNAAVAWNYASGSSYAAGCIAIAVPSTHKTGTPVLSPSSPHVAAYCLQRFGLLLAANDVAHHLWPQMPVADAYEQSLAIRIAKVAGIT